VGTVERAGQLIGVSMVDQPLSPEGARRLAIALLRTAELAED
jgi:hypothetical protein